MFVCACVRACVRACVCVCVVRFFVDFFLSGQLRKKDIKMSLDHVGPYPLKMAAVLHFSLLWCSSYRRKTQTYLLQQYEDSDTVNACLFILMFH